MRNSPPPLAPPGRCFAQLSLLGYVLVPIFVANRWWLTLLYSLFMLAVAAIEAVSRPAQTYPGMLPQVGCMLRGPLCWPARWLAGYPSLLLAEQRPRLGRHCHRFCCCRCCRARLPRICPYA